MNIPEELPGHWSSGAGRDMANDYAIKQRSDLIMSDLSDFALANAVFLADHNSLNLIAYQTAAKERIRWLSVQLALAKAELSA